MIVMRQILEEISIFKINNYKCCLYKNLYCIETLNLVSLLHIIEYRKMKQTNFSLPIIRNIKIEFSYDRYVILLVFYIHNFSY